MQKRVHAGSTAYTANNHPNNTKPRHRYNIHVKRSKNTDDLRKNETIFIKKTMGEPLWNGQRQMSHGGFRLGL